jgi:hypothetical protein
MLYLFAILWLAALTFTVWKRGQQIKRAKNQVNRLRHEQKIQNTESQKGEAEEGNNARGTT